MRVIVIHPELGFYGGAERVLEHYLIEARSRIAAVVVAEKSFGENSENTLAVPTIAIRDHAQFSVSGLTSQLRGLVVASRSLRPDLVHAWAARDWPLASMLGVLIGKPVVATLHDNPLADYIRSKRKALMRWNSYFGLDRVACVSEALRRQCINAGYCQKRLVTVRNGIPPFQSEHTEGPRNESGRDEVSIGFLGGFTADKGIDGLFKVAEHLWGRGTRNWRLLIGGKPQGGSQGDWYSSLEREARRQPWSDRLEWVGWVRNPREFMERVSVLVFPSRIFDCLPTVLLEAGSCGVPVVAAEVGGTSEIILDGETGWLFPAEDWKVAADRIELVIRDESIRVRAGLALQERVRREFSVKRMAADYAALYESLVRN